MTQGVEPWQVGFTGAVLLHALAARYLRLAVTRNFRNEMLDECGLADSSFAREKHRSPLPSLRPSQRSIESSKLPIATDQQRAGRGIRR